MRRLSICLLFSMVVAAHGQWVVQDINLDTGWNAVCLKVNVPDALCADVFDGLPIEVASWWCRSGDGSGGYAESPDNPLAPAPDMRNWYASLPAASTFFRLIGGESYLIKATAPTTLHLMGTPARPNSVLFGGMRSFCGMNIPPGGNVMLSEYFSYYDSLASGFSFSGEDPLDASTVLYPSSKRPESGEAVWVFSAGDGVYEYAGPLNIAIGSGSDVLAFQALHGGVSPQTLTIENVAGIERCLQITSQASIAPPPGQGGVAGAVPLLLAVTDWDSGFPREVYEDFALPWSTNLAAGAKLELKLLPKLTGMPLSADAYQHILTVTDAGSSDNGAIPGGVRCLYQIGVRAEGDLAKQTQPTGLWVGNVVLDGVNRAQTRSGVSNVWDVTAIQPAPKPFTFRVIIHVDEYNVTRLMKEAFLSSVTGGGDYLFASRADAQAFRVQHPDAPIHRISSANFPFGEPLELTGGSFASAGAVLGASVLQGHDDKTNPFKHAYHPDHDNLKFLNGSVTDKSNGATGIGDYESWAVNRDISFTFAEQDPVGMNHNWNILVAGGTYAETITGLSKTEIRTRGAFRLNKISDVSNILYVSGD